MSYREMRLKYVATLNDESLGEDTDPDYELEYLDIGNVESSGQINGIFSYRFADAPSRARRKARHGDVVVSCVRTYLQAIAPIESPPENLVVSTGFAVVRPMRSRLRPGFCKYALREPRFLAEVGRRSAGVSYPAINSSELAVIPIPLPPNDVQLKVELFLDIETERLEKLILAKERLVQLLSEKRKAIIATAVTRGLDANVRLSPSGVEWMPQAPSHWRQLRIGRLFSQAKVLGFPELTVLSVYRDLGVIERASRDDNSNVVPDDLNKYQLVEIGDLVVNKMKAWQGSLGISEFRGITSPDYVVFRPIHSELASYLHYLLRTSQLTTVYLSNSNGIRINQWRIEPERFLNVPLFLPPLHEQKAIVAHIARETTKLDAVRAATERTIALLKERRAALIAAAVTGQLEVGTPA